MCPFGKRKITLKEIPEMQEDEKIKKHVGKSEKTVDI